MRLSGFDLEELLSVLNRSGYSRNIQDIPQLAGIAFCRGPQTYFPNHMLAFSVATETGINAGIFRKKHNSPELSQGDYLKLLVDFTEEIPHHGLCDADVPGITKYRDLPKRRAQLQRPLIPLPAHHTET